MTGAEFEAALRHKIDSKNKPLGALGHVRLHVAEWLRADCELPDDQ